MKLNLTARLVAAVAQFKATNDIRYYLNGVYVEPIPTGGAMIVATNGHALCIWRDLSGEVERPVILRISAKLQAACAGAETKRLQIIDDRLVVTDKLGAETHVQPHEFNKEKPGSWEVHGKFPDWRKVIPEPEHGERVALRSALNAHYITMVDRALSIGTSADKWGCPITVNQPTEYKGIIFLSEKATDFLAVIMPLREAIAPMPEWLPKLEAAAPLGQQPSDAAPPPPPETASGKDDPLYEQAVAIVREHGKVSISLVQRHLRVGYNRTARIIEAMEGSIWTRVNGEPVIKPIKPEPDDDLAPNHLCEGRMVHLPVGEQCSKCGKAVEA